jgi:hypothetical protein
MIEEERSGKRIRERKRNRRDQKIDLKRRKEEYWEGRGGGRIV